MTNQPAILFIETKGYRRFAEFCEACRHYKYIGLCYGLPGVGKTESAKYYSRVELLQGHIDNRTTSPDVVDCKAIYYMAEVVNSARKIKEDIRQARQNLRWLVGDSVYLQRYGNQRPIEVNSRSHPDVTELIIIDEADRLKMQEIEQLREIYDKGRIGLVLIGMPGIEKRLSRYSQLYSG